MATKVTIIIVVVFCFLVSPFIVTPLYHNYKLSQMSQEFYQREFVSKKLPPDTRMIDKYDEIAGPTSSNYCAPFTGVLLETQLPYNEIKKHYDAKSYIAWIEKDTVILNRDINGKDVKHPFDCNTCFPNGIKQLLINNNLMERKETVNYVIVYDESDYTSSFDMRCN